MTESEKKKYWIWSTTLENWNILLEQNIWATRYQRNTKTIRENDRIIFHVKGLNSFKGVYRISGPWYTSTKLEWADELRDNKKIYPHEVTVQKEISGNVGFWNAVPNLSFIKEKDNKAVATLYLQGSPGNHGRPIPEEDYLVILNALRENKDANEGTEVDSVCPVLLGKVKCDDFLEKNTDKLSVILWTEALKNFSAKKPDETFEEWLSKYDVSTLKEIYDFILDMEDKIGKVFDLSTIQPLTSLTTLESAVMCGIRSLQQKFAPERVNMNPHKYSVLKTLFERFNQEPFWIFVVTDHPKMNLKFRDVFDTRMKDGFWGLGERTPHRKSLKKGEKIVFSYGARQFLGSATLDSDSYQLTEDERKALKHDNEFYNTPYGVKLRDIRVWDSPREISDLAEKLDFIKRKDNIGLFFQGGVRLISKHDYDIIIGGSKLLALVGATDGDYVDGLKEFLDANGSVWSGWTFRIQINDAIQLKNQVIDHKYFRLYLHYIISRGGSGEIEAVADVDKWVTSTEAVDTPEPDLTRKDEIDWYEQNPGSPAKTWLHIIKIEKLTKFIETKKLRDYYDNTELKPGTLQNRFAPVVDILAFPTVPSPTSVNKREIDDIDRAAVTHLVMGRNVIFYGPPGSGKTRRARQLTMLFCGNLKDNYSFETANAEWTTYDVVGSPTICGEKELSFKPGFLTSAAIKCQKSLENYGLPHFLIIDEINRANLDLAFGKIFSLLDIEYRDNPILSEADLAELKNKGEYLDSKIPRDFRIVATMNTYDTALLFSMGYAFRRRFAFMEIGSPFALQLEKQNQLDETRWQTITRNGSEIDELYEEIQECISKNVFLQLSTEIRQAFSLPQSFNLVETIDSLNKRIKNGEMDPINPYSLVCEFSEKLTREGIIEAGYSQAVDVIKYALIYVALFSGGNEKTGMVKAIDEGVKAYFIPQIEYYLPNARRKLTIGTREEGKQAIDKLLAIEERLKQLSLDSSSKKLTEIISNLREGKTRMF